MIRLRDMLVIGLVIALIGAGVFFFVKGQSSSAVGSGGLPLIKADANPAKLPPEEPGGDVMPNADSTVFSAMGLDNQTDPSMQGVKMPEDSNAQMPADSSEFAGLRTGFAVPAEPQTKTESLFDKATYGESGSSKYLSGFVEDGAAPPSEPVVEPATEETAAAEPVKENKIVEVTEAPEEVKIAPNKVAEEKAVEKAAEKAPEPKKEEPKKEAVKEEAPPMPAPITEILPEDTPLPDVTDATAAAQNLEAAEKAAISKPPVPEPAAPAPATGPVDQPKIEAPKPDVKKIEEAPYKPNIPQSTGGSGYYIQLASSPAGGDLSTAWSIMKKKYATALAGLQPVYQNASVPGKGDYIRLQAGPMSQSEANDRCKALRSVNPKGACLVIKR